MATGNRLKAWAESAEALAKIVAAVASVLGVVAAALVWASATLSTQPIGVLYLAIVALIVLGIVSLVLSLPAFVSRHWILGGVCLVAAASNLVMGGLIAWNIPPPPTWSLLNVPYELTIDGASPLALARDELVPPGFPGNQPYLDKLAARRATAQLEQQYVVYVSSVFPRNRFPELARVKNPKGHAIAGYVFERQGSSGQWKKRSTGFDAIHRELHLEPHVPEATEFAIALVLSPLTRTAAAAIAQPDEPLAQFVEIH
jgi:hypothetical protein